MAPLLGLLTLAAFLFGAALVLWGFAFSPVYALWLLLILVVPPLLVGRGLALLTGRAARRAPGFPAALQTYLAGHGTPFGATALATGLAGQLLGPPDRPLPPWRTTAALYVATTLVLTAVWALAQPGDAARFYYGLDGTVPYARAPEPRIGEAIGLWLITAAAFLPAFVASLALVKRALPELASGPPRGVFLATAEMLAGIVVAVLATEALYVAIENMITGREAYELGAFESLGTFWQTGFLLRAYLGYPSSGVFFYAALALPFWIAATAAAAHILRGMNVRGVVLRGLLRFQGRPVAAVAAFTVRLMFLVNIGVVMLRWLATDVTPDGLESAVPPGTPPTLTRLAAQFDSLAFGPNGDDVIDKLTVPATVSVEGPAQAIAPHRATTARVLADLGELTKLSFEQTSRRDATLRVRYEPLRNLNRVFMHTDYGLAAGPTIRLVCAAWSNGEISLALENSFELNQNCLPHEFMHMIGFPGHACHYRPSALCNHDLIDGFSAGDRILIRALYDPRLVNGMSRGEAMPIVEQILREMSDAAAAQPAS